MCTRRRVDSRAPLCRAAAPHVPNARSFEGEGFTPTMERHCVNSASISFDKLPLPDGLAEEKVRRHTVEMLRRARRSDAPARGAGAAMRRRAVLAWW